jgi:hypothetical protein
MILDGQRDISRLTPINFGSTVALRSEIIASLILLKLRAPV